MSLGLREFGVEVATVNPGPFLTGFNDRGFETWKSWEDDASERLFDYTKLALPRAQFDPEPVYATMTAVAAGEIETFRNLEPKSMLEETKGNIENVWTKKIRDGLGARPPGLQKSFEMEPETPVSRRWRGGSYGFNITNSSFGVGFGSPHSHAMAGSRRITFLQLHNGERRHGLSLAREAAGSRK
jgi:hypothetical protein